jgi:hypothetical protein
MIAVWSAATLLDLNKKGEAGLRAPLTKGLKNVICNRMIGGLERSDKNK